MSLQDYAILRSVGIKLNNALLAEIKDYREFPKSEAWVRSAIEKVLRTQQGAR